MTTDVQVLELRRFEAVEQRKPLQYSGPRRSEVPSWQIRDKVGKPTRKCARYRLGKTEKV
jgi:hypothetical protein